MPKSPYRTDIKNPIGRQKKTAISFCWFLSFCCYSILFGAPFSLFSFWEQYHSTNKKGFFCECNSNANFVIEVFIDFSLCVFTFLQVTFGISTASTTTPTLLSRETKIIVSWSGALCQIQGLFLDKNMYKICRLLEGCSHPIPVTSGRGVWWLPLRLLS